MRSWTLPTLLLLWVGGLTAGFVAAAGEPAIPHPLAAERSATGSPTATTGGGEPEPAQAQEEAGPVGPPQATIRIGLKDFKLAPDEAVGKAGTITFNLVNEGRYTHDFRVEGEGVAQTAPKVGQGRERQWQIDLKPGTYRISCPISNHSKRGMTGTLVVK